MQIDFTFSDCSYEVDERPNEELFPFCTIWINDTKIKLKSFSPLKNNIYNWNKSINTTIKYNSYDHLNENYCILQFYSNKSNYRTNGIFMGDIELKLLSIICGPKLHKCRVLHGDHPGLFIFKCTASVVVEPIIEIKELMIKDLLANDGPITPSIQIISKTAQNKPLEQIPIHTSTWSLNLTNIPPIIYKITTNDLFDNGYKLRIYLHRISGMLKSKKELGICDIDILKYYKKDKKIYQINSTFIGLSQYTNVEFPLTIKFSVVNFPYYIQSITGEHYFDGKSSEYKDLTIQPYMYNILDDKSVSSDIYCYNKPIERGISFDFDIKIPIIIIRGQDIPEITKFVITTNIQDTWQTLGTFDITKINNNFYKIINVLLPTISTFKPYNLTRRYLAIEIYDKLGHKIYDNYFELHHFILCPSYIELYHNNIIDEDSNCSSNNNEDHGYIVQIFKTIQCNTANLLEIQKLSITADKNINYSYKFTIDDDNIFESSFSSNEAIPPFPIHYQTNTNSLYTYHFVINIISEDKNLLGRVPIYLRDYFPLSESSQTKIYCGILDNDVSYQLKITLHQYRPPSSPIYYDYYSYQDGIYKNNTIYLPKNYEITNIGFELIQKPFCNIVYDSNRINELNSNKLLNNIDNNYNISFNMIVLNSNLNLTNNIKIISTKYSLLLYDRETDELLYELFYNCIYIRTSGNIFQIISLSLQITGITENAIVCKKKIDELIEVHHGLNDFVLLNNIEI